MSPSTRPRKRHNRQSNADPDAPQDQKSSFDASDEWEIVALRIPLGTVTVQARVAWLTGSDLGHKGEMKREIQQHAAKCFDEAWKLAEEQWRKARR